MLKFTERREEGVSGDIVILENGVELYPNEWNGEVYVVKEDGKEPLSRCRSQRWMMMARYCSGIPSDTRNFSEFSYCTMRRLQNKR